MKLKILFQITEKRTRTKIIIRILKQVIDKMNEEIDGKYKNWFEYHDWKSSAEWFVRNDSMINYLAHEKSVPICYVFWNDKKENLPNGLAWMMKTIQPMTHTGTLIIIIQRWIIDRQPAGTTHEIPLDWCMEMVPCLFF